MGRIDKFQSALFYDMTGETMRKMKSFFAPLAMALLMYWGGGSSYKLFRR